MTGLRYGRILLLLALAALVLASAAAGDVTILSVANLTSMAVFAVEVGIIAFGQTLVICGGDGGIDLSVGAISGLAEVIAGLLISHGCAWPLACLAGLGAGAAMGGINGFCVTRLGIPAIIVTLATMFGFSGLALVATGGVNIDLTQAPHDFLYLGQGSVAGLPFQLLCIYLPALALFAFLQHRTAFGRALYLTGTNALAARLAGIRVGRLRATTYVLAGLMAGLAGLVGAARLGTATPTGTDQANLISIAIVVLGGASIFGGDGSVLGTAIASVVIAIADYGLSYNNYNPILQAGVMGLILVSVVLAENLLSARLRAFMRRRHRGDAGSGSGSLG
jgi:ribose/xylose/arabinose/galactoside ABC-type transport system permease subunit